MLRRLSLVLLVLTLATSACFGAIQAGVKGSGAIAAGQNSVGTFEVSVAQDGDVLFGGFKYAEYSTIGTSARPAHMIYSQTLTSLVAVGNYARVQAVGFWNGMLSDLTIEARDNATGTDWFHVTARPRSPLDIIYDKEGYLIKGDLVVVGSTPAPGYATGAGAIRVGLNTGVFQFEAQTVNSGVNGYAYYSEASQSITPISRQPVRIYLPRVQKLVIVDNTAVLSGRGTLNGRPAMVEIKAVDNYTPGPIMPQVRADEFYISARFLYTDSAAAGYSAGGPLIKGDIEVVPMP